MDRLILQFLQSYQQHHHMRQTIKRYIENSSASLTDKQGLLAQLEGTTDKDLDQFYEKVQALLGGVTKSYSSKRPTNWNTR